MASASPRRQELIQLLGLKAEIHPSGIAEDVTEADPSLLVQKLAFQKVEDVAKQYPKDHLVIGADTVVFSKIGFWENRKTKRMPTGCFLPFPEEPTGYTPESAFIFRVRKWAFTKKTEVQFARLTEREIWNYIESKEPMDKAELTGFRAVLPPL